MTFLTEEEAKVLRLTLGLHHTNKRGIVQNKLSPHFVERYKSSLESLIEREYMAWRMKDDKFEHYATPAGQTAIMDHPWR